MSPKDFDEVLDKVGSYGKYQILVTLLIIVPTSFIVSITVNIKIFSFLSPDDYWCQVEGRESTNFSHAQWRALTIPKDKHGNYEKCHQYNTSFIYGNQFKENKTVQDCVSWDHNELQVEESIPTKNDWFCEKSHYSAQVLSVALAGNAVGTFIFPILADRFTGRRMMFFILLILYIVSSLLSMVVTDVYFIMILYFISGTSFQANYQMPYVIGLELMTPDKRAVASLYSFIAWTAAMCVTALFAWILPNWIHLTLFGCVVCVPAFGLWWIMPESPRWLLSKGRISECTDILLKISKTNGHRNVKREMLEAELKSLHSDVHDGGHLYQKFFKHKRLVLNCVLLMIQAAAVFMAYVALVLNVKILPDNYYLSYFILSITELPSNFAGCLGGQYLGRKMTAVVTYAFSIIWSICAIFVYEDKVALIVFVALLKFTITSGVLILYVMTSEIFPTPIRSTGMGLVVVCGMVGSAFSPYLVHYGDNGLFQYWCTIGLCVISTLISFFLPETLGLSLPQTFSEANRLNSNRPMCTWINHWNHAKYLPVSKSAKMDDSDQRNIY